MFKVNAGLSRKITRDFNSTGYSINVEGEITAPLDQPAAILKQINGLFKLAEDALAQEIDRDQGEDAQGRRDEAPRHTNGNGRAPEQPAPAPDRNQPRNGNGQPEPATDKQLKYIQTLGKRQSLSRTQMEDHIAETLGQRVMINQLTKKEAGRVIDGLTQNAPTNGRR